MRSIIFVILLFISLNQVLGQQSADTVNRNNALSIGVGINDFHMKDQDISPFIYSNMIYSANIDYKYRSNKVIHNIEINYSMGNINSAIVNRIVHQYYLDFSYCMVFPVKKFKVFTFPSEFFIGPGVTSSSSLTEFRFFEYKGSDAEYSWYWSRSLDLVAFGNFPLNKNNTITLKLVFPIFQVVSRPNYSPGYDPNEISPIVLKAVIMGNVGFFWDNFFFLGSLNYESRLWKNIFLNFGYKFNFVNINRVRPIGMFMNNLNAGVKWHF